MAVFFRNGNGKDLLDTEMVGIKLPTRELAELCQHKFRVKKIGDAP